MFWTILLGVATGMRTMTGIAVVCWAAYLGWLPVQGTWAFWTAKLVSVIVFTAFALSEYVIDTLPSTPSRTAQFPLTARLSFGILVCVVMATALDQPKAGGVILGVLGALIGAYGGRRVRALGARLVGRDLPVALVESALAVGLAALTAWSVHAQILGYADPALVTPH
jgi:uncharacterized membrane protein